MTNPLSGIMVLLIEGNKAESNRITVMLQHAGISEQQIITVPDCNTAFTHCETHKPHLIFSSALPPDDSGPGYLNFKELALRFPVIILSEDASKTSMEEALASGAQDWMLKQHLSSGVLLKTIRFSLKRTEDTQELREAIERYLLVAKATSDIAWDWEITKRSTYWIGSGISNTMGYAQNELTVSSEFWEEHLHPEDKERVMKKLKEVFTNTQSNNWEDEYRFRNSSGEYVHIYDRGFIIYRDAQPVRMLGIMEDVTAKVHMEKEQEQEKAFQQKQLAEAVITAQEKERSEIGKELHDNVNQLLTASRLYIDAAATDQNNIKFLLSQASSFIKNAIEEIRTLSKVLHTPLISEIGLTETVGSLAEEIMMVSDLQIHFNRKSFNEAQLEYNLKLTIYRIVQEQLTNILKHANASKAEITLENNDTELLLKIKDNGIGFDTEQKKRGVGLANIRSRATMYNGQMRLESAPEKGSTLFVHFPLAQVTPENFILQ